MFAQIAAIGGRVSPVQYTVEAIPSVTPQTLAVGRMLFGSLLLFFLPDLPADFVMRLATAGPMYPITRFLDQTGLLSALSANPSFASLFLMVTAGLLVAFILGAATVVVYPLLVMAFWLLAFLGNQGHFITPLLLALTATLGAPWSAAWSIDSLFRSQAVPQQTSRLFGYPLWLLGLTIGLTYMSAGLSKLILTDGAWLWDTGARNGLLQDLDKALSDIGMVISNNYLLSLIASVLSSFGQIIYVYSSFTRSPAIKYAICFLVALPFLIGLALTMGLFWWPWGILVLMLYLPWQSIDNFIARRLPSPPAHDQDFIEGRHFAWFMTATAGLIGIHLFAILSRSEWEPVYSNYPMYADRMRAGSEYEAEFWNRFTPHDRHFRPVIHLVAADNTVQDVSYQNRLARFWDYERVYRSSYLGLQPFVVLRSASSGQPIPSDTCRAIIKSVAAVSSVPVTQVRYAKHYFDLKNGRVEWLPVSDSSWISVQLEQGCRYRQQ